MNLGTTQDLGYLGEKLDLTVKQGSTFGPFTFILKNPDQTAVDISQIEIRGKVKKSKNSTEFVAFNIIKTDSVNGTFELSLSSEQTGNLDCGSSLADVNSKYIYDVELDSGLGQVTPFIYGDLKVFREVTR